MERLDAYTNFLLVVAKNTVQSKLSVCTLPSLTIVFVTLITAQTHRLSDGLQLCRAWSLLYQSIV